MKSAIKVDVIKTKPYGGQKPGTSGLRKRVRTFPLFSFLFTFRFTVGGHEIMPKQLFVDGNARL